MRRQLRPGSRILVGLVVVMAGACAQASPAAVPSPTSVTSPPTTDRQAASVDLAALTIDDQPAPRTPYRREEWPTWVDIDGDGCDARSQALIAQSLTPAQVVEPGCKVVAGDWRSPYDGVETRDPSDLDADHMVPLENVHQSGGWQWDAATRRAYANDQGVLVMVTAHANRSKGSSTPAEWRPALESDWCAYATQWVRLKVQWRLTATTRERDALGQMLDTCAPD